MQEFHFFSKRKFSTRSFDADVSIGNDIKAHSVLLMLSVHWINFLNQTAPKRISSKFWIMLKLILFLYGLISWTVSTAFEFEMIALFFLYFLICINFISCDKCSKRLISLHFTSVSVRSSSHAINNIEYSSTSHAYLRCLQK